ncbi:MAG: hypothetical protein RL404_2257 [Pseudomonadota bacterium]
MSSVLRSVLLCTAYVAVAGLGLAFAFVHGTVSPVWPPTGLAIAMLTLWGPRFWPAIAGGAFIANFFFASDPLAVSAGIAAGNALEGVTGAVLLRHWQVAGEVTRIRDAACMIAVALLAPCTSALAGVLSLTLGGLSAWAAFPRVWTVWWFGDCMGALVFVPLLLAFLGRSWPLIFPERRAELAVICLVTLLLLRLAMMPPGDLTVLGIERLPLSVFAFPPLLWATLRLRPREASAVLAWACLLAVSFTASDTLSEAPGPLLQLQMELFGIAASTLAMMGVIIERTRAREGERDERARLAAILASLREGVVVADMQGTVLEMNPAALEIHGFKNSDEGVGKMVDFASEFELSDLTGEVIPLSRWPLSRLLRGEEFADFEVRVTRHGRHDAFVVSYSGRLVRDGSGRSILCVLTIRDVTERKRAEQREREAALHDPLTLLPNRALVLEYGSHLLAAARRNHCNSSLLFVDLDHFKPINDEHGHAMGDRVLQVVANRLKECTRQEDLVGRLGGDEFVILLPYLDAGRQWAAVVAQHVVDSISRPIIVDGLELSVSPSIGISIFPDHGTDVAALIHAADLAMYEAKQSGRACFRIYSPGTPRNLASASGGLARNSALKDEHPSA